MGLPYLPLNIDVQDQAKQGLYASFASSTKITAPVAIRDNGLYLAIRAMEADITGQRPWDDIDITTAVVSVSIDNADIFPTSGNFYLQFGPTTTGTLNSTTTATITGSTAGIISGMSVTGNGIPANTTATISGSTVTLSNSATLSASGIILYFFNQTSAQASTVGPSNLQNALNSLASISAAGNVVVTQTDTDFIVTFNSSGAQPLIVGNAGSLYPASSIQTISSQTGTSTLPSIQVIRILQLPATFQSTFTAFPGHGGSVTTITSGGSGINNLQQITLNPVPYAGTWTITTSYGTSGPISATALASDVQTALQAIGSTPASTWIVSGGVSGPYNITNTTGLSISALGINTSGLIVPIGMQGELNLATPGMIARFDALPVGTNEWPALLEVTIQFPGSDPQTILQAPVTVLKEVIRNGAIALPPYPVGISLQQANATFPTLIRQTPISISAAGTTNLVQGNLTGGNSITTTFVTVGAGSGTYSNTVELPAGVIGDIYRVHFSMPATNATIVFQDNLGNTLDTLIPIGITNTVYIECHYGTQWSKDFRTMSTTNFNEYSTSTVSGAGSVTITPASGCSFYTLKLQAQAGSGAYEYDINLATTGRSSGDKFELALIMDASTNQTVKVKSNAIQLWSETGTGIAYNKALFFTFDGTTWQSDQ